MPYRPARHRARIPDVIGAIRDKVAAGGDLVVSVEPGRSIVGKRACC